MINEEKETQIILKIFFGEAGFLYFPLQRYIFLREMHVD